VAFSDGKGNVTKVSPGRRLEAQAGWLHFSLSGSPVCDEFERGQVALKLIALQKPTRDRPAPVV
jgi:hypothetical protein